MALTNNVVGLFLHCVHIGPHKVLTITAIYLFIVYKHSTTPWILRDKTMDNKLMYIPKLLRL